MSDPTSLTDRTAPVTSAGGVRVRAMLAVMLSVGAASAAHAQVDTRPRAGSSCTGFAYGGAISVATRGWASPPAVRAVQAGSPGAAAGVVVGDSIVAVDGEYMLTLRAPFDRAPDAPVTLYLVGAGGERTVTFKLGRRVEAPGTDTGVLSDKGVPLRCDPLPTSPATAPRGR